VINPSFLSIGGIFAGRIDSTATRSSNDGGGNASGKPVPAISDPTSNPREQKPVAKGPYDVVFGAGADSSYGDQYQYAYNDHHLCRQRLDVAEGTAD
jgi:hypothetical protein